MAQSRAKNQTCQETKRIWQETGWKWQDTSPNKKYKKIGKENEGKWKDHEKEVKEHETNSRRNRWRNPLEQKARKPPLPLENQTYQGNDQNLGWNGLKMKGHITQQKGKWKDAKGKWKENGRSMKRTWKRMKEVKEHETNNRRNRWRNPLEQKARTPPLPLENQT